MAKHAHKGKNLPPPGPKKAGKPAGSRKPAARKHPAPTPLQKPKNSFIQWLVNAFGFKSMAIAAVGSLLLYGVARNNSGYRWMWINLLQGNWKFIQSHRKATLDERYQMKLGLDYVFCDYIRKNTPEDAVILFPLKKHITEKGGDQQLSDNIKAKYWVTHFVYPRKVLYKDEQESNPRYKDVTHVAIVAGHGYEDLDYEVWERSYFAVLPKKAPANKEKEADKQEN
ncbi:MAG: hypothetical protein LBF67_08835 [Prevotellaceae bacterium]|jgi:hypothetical protein|nr:hypothetical protein [Prevotellaceae bacterium]